MATHNSYFDFVSFIFVLRVHLHFIMKLCIDKLLYCRFPKTKKALMNEWLNETVDPVLPVGSPSGMPEVHTSGVPTCYMRSPATPLRRSTSVNQVVQGTLLNLDLPGGSAKKRWLRQAISEETESPHFNGLCPSPNSRPGKADVQFFWEELEYTWIWLYIIATTFLRLLQTANYQSRSNWTLEYVSNSGRKLYVIKSFVYSLRRRHLLIAAFCTDRFPNRRRLHHTPEEAQTSQRIHVIRTVLDASFNACPLH